MLPSEQTLLTSSEPATTFEVSVAFAMRVEICQVPNSSVHIIVVLMGPEQNMSVLAGQLEGVRWDGAGIGYGVRGSRLQELTVRLEGKNSGCFYSHEPLERSQLAHPHFTRRYNPALSYEGAVRFYNVRLLLRHCLLGHPKTSPSFEQLHRCARQGSCKHHPLLIEAI